MHVEHVPELKIWICRCTFNEKDIPKNAGFRWNPDQKCWYTKEPAVAAAIMTPEKVQELNAHLEERQVKRAEPPTCRRSTDRLSNELAPMRIYAKNTRRSQAERSGYRKDVFSLSPARWLADAQD